MADVRAASLHDAAPMLDDGRRAQGLRLFVGDTMSGATEGFALPTGTVTFLLTDVEGSSRRWEDVAGGDGHGHLPAL